MFTAMGSVPAAGQYDAGFLLLKKTANLLRPAGGFCVAACMTTSSMAETSSTTSAGSDNPSDSTRASMLPDASLVGVALIWGINIPVMKTGLDQLDGFVFNGIRLAVSAAVLAGFAVAERRRVGRPAEKVPFRTLLVYGLMVGAVYQLAFLLGVKRTTSGNTALIIATVPMWTALLARIFISEKISRLAWFGLLVALAGTTIVALQKGDVTAGPDHLLGNGIILMAALMWSAGTVYSRPLLKKISPLQLSAAAAAVGLPFHLLLGVGGYTESVAVLQSWQLWLIILYSGVLSSGLALPMWSFGVRHAGAAHAAIIQNLIPVVAIMTAWLTRGEPATNPQILGGAMIVAGLVIMRRTRQPSVPVQPSAEPTRHPVVVTVSSIGSDRS